MHQCFHWAICDLPFAMLESVRARFSMARFSGVHDYFLESLFGG
jgi:hypothetical protein